LSFSRHHFPTDKRNSNIPGISQMYANQISQKRWPHQLSADWSDSDTPEYFTTLIFHTAAMLTSQSSPHQLSADLFYYQYPRSYPHMNFPNFHDSDITDVFTTTIIHILT